MTLEEGTVKYCKNCGNQLNEQDIYCPECGTEVTEMIGPVDEDMVQPEMIKTVVEGNGMEKEPDDLQKVALQSKRHKAIMYGLTIVVGVLLMVVAVLATLLVVDRKEKTATVNSTELGKIASEMGKTSPTPETTVPAVAVEPTIEVTVTPMQEITATIPAPPVTTEAVELESYTNNDILFEVDHFINFNANGADNRKEDLERFKQYIAGNYQNYGKNCYTYINDNLKVMMTGGDSSLYPYAQNNIKEALATAIMASYLSEFGEINVWSAASDAISNGKLSSNYPTAFLSDQEREHFVNCLDGTGTYLIPALEAYYVEGLQFGEGNLESEQLALDSYNGARRICDSVGGTM